MDKKCEANYKIALNKRNVILLIKGGSELLGLADGDSDRDEIGIFIEEPKDLAGFDTFDYIQYRSAVDQTGDHHARSGKGDVDLALYGLRKFIKLAVGGNPNLLQLLFASKSSCIIKTEIGESLQALAPKIVSKKCADAFKGYLHAQRLRLMGQAGQMGVIRQDLIDSYGYDTKYAMHMLRLGLQGIELMRTGRLQLPMILEDRDYLLRIRHGERNKQQCLDGAAMWEADIDSLAQGSKLPDRPDYDAVEQWLMQQYKDYWKMGR